MTGRKLIKERELIKEIENKFGQIIDKNNYKFGKIKREYFSCKKGFPYLVCDKKFYIKSMNGFLIGEVTFDFYKNIGERKNGGKIKR